MIDFAALSAPFPPAAVSWRVGSTTKDKDRGLALAYIDARDVMDRLDAVAGPANWQDSYATEGTRVICTLSLKIGDEWVSKSDGAGDTDVESEKGAISDAFKRAAVKWGIGRYLYSVDAPWVELDTYKSGDRTVVKGIKRSEFAKLAKLLPGASAPAAQGPDNAVDEAEEEVRDIIRLITACMTVRDLQELWRSARVNAFLKAAHPDDFERVTAAKDRRKAQIGDTPANLLMAG